MDAVVGVLPGAARADVANLGPVVIRVQRLLEGEGVPVLLAVGGAEDALPHLSPNLLLARGPVGRGHRRLLFVSALTARRGWWRDAPDRDSRAGLTDTTGNRARSACPPAV